MNNNGDYNDEEEKEEDSEDSDDDNNDDECDKYNKTVIMTQEHISIQRTALECVFSLVHKTLC